MTSRQVVDRAGITYAMLNQWEAAEPSLTPPSWRQDQGQIGRWSWTRSYNEIDVIRLRAIKHLLREGTALRAAIQGADDQVVEWWRTVRAVGARVCY